MTLLPIRPPVRSLTPSAERPAAPRWPAGTPAVHSRSKCARSPAASDSRTRRTSKRRSVRPATKGRSTYVYSPLTKTESHHLAARLQVGHLARVFLRGLHAGLACPIEIQRGLVARVEWQRTDQPHHAVLCFRLQQIRAAYSCPVNGHC